MKLSEHVKRTFKSYLPFTKNIIFPLISLTLPLSFIEQKVINLPPETDGYILAQSFNLIVSYIGNFFIILILSYGLKENSSANKGTLSLHIKHYIKDLVIETLRMMGKIALGLLLLFPWIKRLAESYFILYIVIFDPEYSEGKVDALLRARQLLKRHLSIFFTIMLFFLILLFAVGIMAGTVDLFESPLKWLALYILNLILTTFSFLLFYEIYLYLDGKIPQPSKETE